MLDPAFDNPFCFELLDVDDWFELLVILEPLESLFEVVFETLLELSTFELVLVDDWFIVIELELVLYMILLIRWH